MVSVDTTSAPPLFVGDEMFPKCPHCSNHDRSLLEQLRKLNLSPNVWVYLCKVCSKEFISGVNTDE